MDTTCHVHRVAQESARTQFVLSHTTVLHSSTLRLYLLTVLYVIQFVCYPFLFEVARMVVFVLRPGRIILNCSMKDNA